MPSLCTGGYGCSSSGELLPLNRNLWLALLLCSCARTGSAPYAGDSCPHPIDGAGRSDAKTARDGLDAKSNADLLDARGGDGAGDGRVSLDSLPSSKCTPWSGSWTFEVPAPVTEINSLEHDLEPYLTADGLAIFLASSRSGGAGQRDIYFAARSGPEDPFGPVQSYVTVNTPADETRFAVSRDGLTAYLATTRAGGAGLSDIWLAHRPTSVVPFVSSGFAPLEAVNTANDEFDPFPSADGLRIYFSSSNWLANASGSDLLVAERTSPTAPFSPPQAVPGMNAPSASEGNPSLTDDGLVFVFNSNRSGGSGGFDIWYATRPTSSSPFDAPQPMPVINSATDEGEPFVTADGCAVYFTRPIGSQTDIYRARFKAGP